MPDLGAEFVSGMMLRVSDQSYDITEGKLTDHFLPVYGQY